MTKKKLLEYCKSKGIWLPPKADNHTIHAAIVRAALNGAEVDVKSCFGLWEHEDSACLVCDLAPTCGEVSLGVKIEDYVKAMEASEKPMRFASLSKVKKARI